ncbi:MAG: HlyD family efflux transporter periplasmic adaptor subunit [Treponema sp.]|jgi:multidrug efflux pump subunit AcrA (membrane-fusion protein)|nr:HlyD family efflux transporter periplasmic adaptor subunit [Treponema sp.]
MKLTKKTAGAIIFAALLLLLFFSKTIYTYNLPAVTGTKPKRGSLSKLEISSGITSWAETEAVYAVSGGTVGRVFTREGDAVEKDQVLFEMDFDIAAAERRYAEIGNNIGKLEADINGLRTRLGNIRAVLAATESGTDTEEPNAAPPAFSGQAGIIALEIGKATIALNDAQLSFEWGFLSKNDLVNVENNLKALLFKYSAEADDLELSLASKLMDMENLKLSIEAVRDLLRDYRNNAVIRAPASGIVLNLPVERGKYYPENALLVSIGVGRNFLVECSISLNNNFVNPGDTCELSNASHVLNGTVRRIKPSIQGKTVIISISSNDVSEGETFDITFEKNSSASFVLVPNSAVNQDNNGYFLYQIKRRKGIMGDEYYLARLNIFIGDSDRQNTAVLCGLTFFDPIVLVSGKALSDGVTVSLKNPEDFFES